MLKHCNKKNNKNKIYMFISIILWLWILIKKIPMMYLSTNKNTKNTQKKKPYINKLKKWYISCVSLYNTNEYILTERII